MILLCNSVHILDNRIGLASLKTSPFFILMVPFCVCDTVCVCVCVCVRERERQRQRDRETEIEIEAKERECVCREKVSV